MMLNKELLLVNCVPYIEFQGVTFKMRCTWDNFEGEWPGKNASIDPNPPKFIVNNVEYSLTYVGLLHEESRIEITPAAHWAEKENPRIYLMRGFAIIS